jgi:hypothetical protein
MKRREFLAASTVAGLASVPGFAAVPSADKQSPRDLLEMRMYHMLPGSKRKLLNDFLKDAVLPAYERNGNGPIGVFEPVHGADSLTLYVLIPHKSFESVLSASARIVSDPKFARAAEGFYSAPSSDPPYVRVESSLMVAFERMPQVAVPALAAEKKSRIFEMRIYESHNGKAGKRKVEMFNQGGEIAIFRKTGLEPVFFGETIIGSRIPNLTYMLVFADNAAREKAWGVFRDDPDWKKLSTDSYYADTVSNITDLILRPTGYSQI